MKVIHARNVNDAIVKGAQLLKEGGRAQDSRAGGKLECPEPVCTVYERPLERVLSNRSNDIVWGCYGANAVQFPMLLECMAAHIGVEPGHYRQVSDSFHAYHDAWPKISDIAERFSVGPYVQGEVSVHPLSAQPDSFDAELRRWFDSAPEHISLEQWDSEAEQALWRVSTFPGSPVEDLCT